MTTTQNDVLPRVLLVINPESGVVEGTTRLRQYLKFFEAHNWPCQVFPTSEEADTVAVVRQAIDTGVDLVVVSYARQLKLALTWWLFRAVMGRFHRQ